MLRGVYVRAGLELTPEIRRRAIGLVIPQGAVPTGLAAAWAHGLIPDCPRLTSGRREPVGLLEAAVVAGRELGLPVYDAALARGLSHRRLLGAVGPARVGVAALADARARDAAESALRQSWYDADLPTPQLGFRVPEPHPGRRVCLAHPSRMFAATTEQWSRADLARARLLGWWVCSVAPERLWPETDELLAAHLRREFHRQLLTQLSA